MKTLIIYTTKHGSVTKAVDILNSKLTGETVTVNLRQGRAPDLKQFDTVIAGGSVYLSRTQNELTNYLKQHSAALLGKRLGLFLCAGEGDPQGEQFKRIFPEDIYRHAAAKAVFGHEIYWERLNLLERWAVKLKEGVSGSFSKLSVTKIAEFAKAITAK